MAPAMLWFGFYFLLKNINMKQNNLHKICEKYRKLGFFFSKKRRKKRSNLHFKKKIPKIPCFDGFSNLFNIKAKYSVHGIGIEV